MNFFNKKSASEPATQPDKPGNNKLALLILILLVAVFGYLYFFTSLIVPHGASPVAPSAPPPQVKQAMPPRSADVAAAPAGEVKPPAPVPATPGIAAKTPPAPAPGTAAKTPSAPAPATAAKALPASAPAAQKPAPPVPAKVEAKSAPLPKKVEQKPAPAAAADKEKKPAETAQKKSVKAAAPVKKRKELFTLNLGEFSSDAQATAAEEKLVQLKIKPVSKRQTQKTRQMNRLFYNAYSDYDTYSSELAKLKKLASNSFAVEKDGKYYVYSGSYSSAELAHKEQKRLSASGVKVSLQKVKLPLSLVQISAGEFSARADADRAAANLRRQGLKVVVVPKKR